MRGRGRMLATLLAVLLVLGLRAAATYGGYVWGDVASRLADLMTAVAVVAIGLLLWPRRPSVDGGPEGPAGLSRLAEVLAVGAAVAAALYTFPLATPSNSDAPACRNAQVHRTSYIATTVDRGANVRAGPSEDTQQIARLPGNCSVGFVGYCLGVPEPDFATQVPDSRWLILPAGRGFVAAGVVQSQRPERDLRPQPCQGAHHDPAPPRLSRTGLTADGIITASATSVGAYVVGFALYQPTNASGDALFHPIGLDTSPGDGFTLAYARGVRKCIHAAQGHSRRSSPSQSPRHSFTGAWPRADQATTSPQDRCGHSPHSPPPADRSYPALPMRVAAHQPPTARPARQARVTVASTSTTSRTFRAPMKPR